MKAVSILVLASCYINTFSQSENIEKIREALQENNIQKEFLPNYDINNLPIALWMLVSGDDYKGFIVTGHADSAVCEVASLEILSALKKLPNTNASFFTYGVGYDIRPTLTDVAQQKKYNDVLFGLHKKFLSLMRKTPERVFVTTLEYEAYQDKTDLIWGCVFNNARKPANVANVLEFNLDDIHDFPLIMPFLTSAGDTVSFTISKNRFGDLFTKSVSRSITGELESYIRNLQKIKYKNDSVKACMKVNYKVYTWVEFIFDYDFDEYGYFDCRIENEIISISRDVASVIIAPSPKTVVGTLITGYERWDPVSRKMIVERRSSRNVSYGEAVNMDHPSSPLYGVSGKEKVRKDIEDITERINMAKREIHWAREKIGVSNELLEAEIARTQKMKKDFETYNLAEIMIDAFLRGWPFASYSTKTDDDLDRWYDKQRAEIWGELIGQYSAAGIDGKVGGIFKADDVFFKVALEDGKEYRITPFKVIGNRFLLVMDPHVRITQLLTPFNFRK